MGLLSCSALADFTSVDSIYLSSISDKVNSIEANIETYFPEFYLEISKLSTINSNVASSKTLLNNIYNSLNASTTAGYSVAAWALQIDGRLWTGNRSMAQIADSTDQKLSYDGYSVAAWVADVVTTNIQNRELLSDIFDIMNGEKEKEEDALDAYSASGGKSASDTSSDVGAISSSLSSSFDSGVSASDALDAVSDNEDTFEYFFFEMKDDLNTASTGGSSKAPLRGAKSNGSDVPDFLSDYWEGLG